MKAIINGKIILKNEIVENKILLFDKKIKGILDEIPDECKEDIYIIDAEGKYVSPGLIDIHIHGNIGYDFMYADMWNISDMNESISATGVTGYLATTMTMEKDLIYTALDNLKVHIKRDPICGAKMLGVHLEGPFLNERYAGAQDPNFILKPSSDFIKEYEDIIKIITYAPEQDEGFEFTKYIKENTDIVLSMGHTNATYEEACEAIKYGAQNATHLFNAMTGFNHRDPGVVGASIFNNVKCELIADNIHVNKDIYQFLLKNKQMEDIILVTDAMEATGLTDGVYSIGGHSVNVKDGCARLVSNGALAGSTSKLNQSVKNFYDNTSLELHEAIQLASLNPAISLGMDNRKGSLEVGKDSDIAIFDEDLSCFMTIVEGIVVYEKILTIAEIKEKLKELPNKKVRSMNGSSIGINFGSYRGNYEDMYIEIASNNEETITRDELIEVLDKALCQGSMHGYKGGDFSIEDETKVALAEYGLSTGFYIQDIIDNGDYIIIKHMR